EQWALYHRRAGGMIGSAVAGPLNSALTAWGAAIVLIAAGLFGAMLSFDLSLAAVADRARAMIGPAEEDEDRLEADERELELNRPEPARPPAREEKIEPVFPLLPEIEDGIPASA